MTRYYTLRLTETEMGAARSLLSVTIDNGDESESSPEDRAAMERVVDKIDAAQAIKTPCSNCGSPRHLACCARCGESLTRRRRVAGMNYCGARCERDQARDDEGSAKQEESC